jgi:hypothetical protein
MDRHISRLIIALTPAVLFVIVMESVKRNLKSPKMSSKDAVVVDEGSEQPLANANDNSPESSSSVTMMLEQRIQYVIVLVYVSQRFQLQPLLSR